MKITVVLPTYNEAENLPKLVSALFSLPLDLRVLIVDDEINTAGTLCGVVELLKKKKARNIYFGCTHPVLSGPAIERLASARIKQVVITDTIHLPQEKRIQKMKLLSVTPLFVDAMRVWAKRA